MSLSELDALGQAELVRRGDATPLELVEAAIARVEAVNPRLNAVVTMMFEQALEEATSVRRTLPLAGVPFLVKDLGAEIAGVRHTRGSRALQANVARSTSRIAQRYRDAGLIVIGRTSTPEFGNHSTTEPELFGPTLNPWDPGVTAGGSSGGAAAAVAARLVPAAHGTDGAGSIRIPASCCGVFGLKPTRGRVSRNPDVDDLAGLNVQHALTRSVRDSAALLDAIVGREPGDPAGPPVPVRPYLDEVSADPGRLRIAWSVTPPIDAPVDPVCAAAAAETATLLEALGHHVEEARPEFDGETLVGPLALVWAVGNVRERDAAARLLGRPVRDDEVEETTRELVEWGEAQSAGALVEAVSALASAARDVNRFFERFDAWVTPTLAQPPLPPGVLNRSQGGAVAWWRFDCTFNAWNPIANVTGQPAMSLPLHWTDEGLPIGTLIFGRYGEEAMLFRLAAQLEAARPWAGRIPPLAAH